MSYGRKVQTIETVAVVLEIRYERERRRATTNILVIISTRLTVRGLVVIVESMRCHASQQRRCERAKEEKLKEAEKKEQKKE